MRAYAVERDARHVYVAYEYVAGQTLRQALREGALDDAASVEAAAQVLDAIAHAHHRGIVHRDVKPANLLVEDEPRVSVRLLDFGLAQFDESDGLTATGDVPGTLAYISPERLAGKQATGAADVWAVGVILWEALAGHQPFFTASPVETARLIGAEPRRSRTSGPISRSDSSQRSTARLRWTRAGARIHASSPVSCGAASAKRPRAVAGDPSPRFGFSRSGLRALCSPVGSPPARRSSSRSTRRSSLVLAAVAAGLAALLAPRLGLAVALVVPVLPLGDVSLGLALAYLPLAAVWLGLFWGDARHAFLCAAGPILALVGLLALVPLVAEQAHGAVRRAFQRGGRAARRRRRRGSRPATAVHRGVPPLGLGIADSESPRAVAGALWRTLEANPAIAIEAAVLATAAATLPLARRHGLRRHRRLRRLAARAPLSRRHRSREPVRSSRSASLPAPCSFARSRPTPGAARHLGRERVRSRPYNEAR